MEIKDYLRIIGRRIWIPVVVPVLAGGAAAATLSQEPTRYEARGNAVLSGVVEGASDTKQFVAEFRGAVTSAAVVDQVSEDLDVSDTGLSSGIGTRQVGSSSIISLSYTTRDAARAPQILEAVATRALELVLRSQVGVAEKTVEAARAAHDEAQARLGTLIEETKIAKPTEAFTNAQTEITQLRIRYEESRARGEAAVAASFDRAIKEREAVLAALGSRADQYEALVEARRSALGAMSSAEQALIQATGRLNASTSGSVITVSESATQVPASDNFRRIVAVVGTALLLALGLVLLLETTRSKDASGRRGGHGTMPSGQPAALDVQAQRPGVRAGVATNGHGEAVARP